MKKETMKVRIKDTGEIVNVENVGDDTYLDAEHKEVYNRDDFDEVGEETNFGGFKVMSPEEFADNLKNLIREREKAMKDEFAKMILSYEMSLTLEVLKKRPFMSPDRIHRRVQKIMRNTLERL